ncbi:MAG: hypothetical protein ACUVQY_04310 [Thermoproteota archaeon]
MFERGFPRNIKGGMPFENEVVAVKLHMGEPRNKNHLRAEDVKKLVGLLKERVVNPFFSTRLSPIPARGTVLRAILRLLP